MTNYQVTDQICFLKIRTNFNIVPISFFVTIVDSRCGDEPKKGL
jgi:hypothetical protein